MLAGLLVGGSFAARASGGGDDTVTSASVQPDSPKLTESFPHNEFGLTVGTPTDADRQHGNLPDLTPAQTDAGDKGYLIAKDFYFPDPKTPAEAVEQTSRRLDSQGRLIVKIYQADGTTLIGSQLVTTVTEGGDINDVDR